MATSGQWSTDLCDCTKDCSSCCLTWWCPCIAFGRIAEVVDKGTTTCCASGTLYMLLAMFTGFEFLYTYKYRTQLRREYLLPKQPCNDCLVHCFCKPCALCQEYRELKYRGLNPSYGWQENVSKQSHGVVMPPISHEEMKR